jgi:hypothetical protein
MEELAEFTPSGNLRTPIQKAKNELNAAQAQYDQVIASKPPVRGAMITAQVKLRHARNRLQKLESNKTRKNLHNSGVLDYIVVEGTELNSFTENVMKKMAEGYILQGGVSYNTKYYQALVKSNSPPRNLLSNNTNLLSM